MSLEDAVDLVLFAFANGQPGDVFVQRRPLRRLNYFVRL